MNKPLIPPHLIPLADTPEEEDDVVTLRLRCPCGSLRFRLEESVFTPEEQAQADAYTVASQRVCRGCSIRDRKDSQGQMTLMRRRLPFGRWEPLKPLLPEPPAFIDVQALRGTCRICGAQHLVFDNRVHGFDALSGEFTGAPMAWQPHWQEIPMPEEATVCMEVYNDVALEEMRAFIPGFRTEDACRAFGHIAVWSETAQGRDDLLFESI